jgi:hypothetical protein
LHRIRLTFMLSNSFCSSITSCEPEVAGFACCLPEKY